MNNRFKIEGKQTILYVDYKATGEVLKVIIDTTSLERAKSFPNTWTAVKVPSGKFVIRGVHVVEKKKTQVHLYKWIMETNEMVRNINGNELDLRLSNLTDDRSLSIIRGNEYRIEDSDVYLILRKKNGETAAECIIDKDDLERVLAHGTWILDQTDDSIGFSVVSVTYPYENKRKRLKTSMSVFILGLTSKDIIHYRDGDRLNNRKSNLVPYASEMLNDYIIEGDVTKIHLKDDIYTLIDTEDLERVNALGYTWCLFQGERGYPYAVNNTAQKNGVYLHRFIMNCPDGYAVDHIHHNSLDNRKKMLSICSNSENQQNRIGPRKGSKSQIRGVSWDKNNQDWIVNVRGKHILRTKDLELAKKTAKEEIDKMVYLKKIGK